MWSSIKQAYADSARIMAALPLLFALPLAAELIQHVSEYRARIFDSLAAAQAAESDPGRMAFGQVKILALMLVPFWVARWHFLRDRSDRPVLGDRRSVILYIPVLLLGIAIALVQQFGGSLLSPFVPEAGIVVAIGFAFFVATLALEIYLTAWKVGAALGNPRLTIPRSLRIMHGNFWWSFGFYVAAFLPVMVLHYGLFAVSIGRSEVALWVLLVLDSAVVGYLGLIMATASVLVARRAAERSRAALAPA